MVIDVCQNITSVSFHVVPVLVMIFCFVGVDTGQHPQQYAKLSTVCKSPDVPALLCF